MKVYNYSEARRQLTELLNRASREGGVEIRRRDGQAFWVRPAAPSGSPLDVLGIDAGLSRKEFWIWCARAVDRPVGSSTSASCRTNPGPTEIGRRSAKVLPSIPPGRKKTVRDRFP